MENYVQELGIPILVVERTKAAYVICFSFKLFSALANCLFSTWCNLNVLIIAHWVSGLVDSYARSTAQDCLINQRMR